PIVPAAQPDPSFPSAPHTALASGLGTPLPALTHTRVSRGDREKRDDRVTADLTRNADYARPGAAGEGTGDVDTEGADRDRDRPEFAKDLHSIQIVVLLKDTYGQRTLSATALPARTFEVDSPDTLKQQLWTAAYLPLLHIGIKPITPNALHHWSNDEEPITTSLLKYGSDVTNANKLKEVHAILGTRPADRTGAANQETHDSLVARLREQWGGVLTAQASSWSLWAARLADPMPGGPRAALRGPATTKHREPTCGQHRVTAHQQHGWCAVWPRAFQPPLPHD
ncbi:hypothetical protein BC828DRAFT_400803, partial [Blastocladiella britannica]